LILNTEDLVALGRPLLKEDGSLLGPVSSVVFKSFHYVGCLATGP